MKDTKELKYKKVNWLHESSVNPCETEMNKSIRTAVIRGQIKSHLISLIKVVTMED